MEELLKQLIEESREGNKMLKSLLQHLVNTSELNPVQAKFVFLEFTRDTVKIPSQCNAISFLNTGDTTIKLNGAMTLDVGDPMITLSQGHSDYDTTEYTVSWGAGANPKLLVIKRMIVGHDSYYNKITLKGIGV